MSFFTGRRQVSEPAEQENAPRTPRPLPPQQPVGFETVLGANSVMEGVLRSNANVRLDGTFTGTLEITGNVLVGETAKINADINAKNISIAGAVRGNVSGKKVQLLRTGRVWGDISATALTTEEGAFIDGRITMVGHDAAQAATSPPTATDEQTVEASPEEETVQAVEPELVDELEPIEQEARQRGVEAENLLRETDMLAEGAPPTDTDSAEDDDERS